MAKKNSDRVVDFKYPKLSSLIKKYSVDGRTESASFLMWFLDNYYRLEDSTLEDSICDRSDDKGVDGIYVDHNLKEIDIFQAKLFQNPAKTLGDTYLKSLVGTLSQFKTAGQIKAIAADTRNTELKRLLEAENIAELVEQGYAIKGIFVTNASSDPAATTYLKNHPSLTLYDRPALEAQFISDTTLEAVSGSVKFGIGEVEVSEWIVSGNRKIIFAPLRAVDLVKMDGIANQKLFALNVRRSLGRTKVNKDIQASIRDASEHRNFLLYHNGLTVICSRAKRTPDTLEIEDYTVVNGCQSLTSLFNERESLTGDMRLLTRIIQIPKDDADLTFKITHHSNNQNGITARDLQSNNRIQSRLQTEFESTFKNVAYAVKRGDATEADTVIDNELAGRILLAFDLKEPWSCHQTYRLFDDVHSQVFGRPEVDAYRIYALYLIYVTAKESLEALNNKLMAKYSLTPFLLLYLLKQVLDEDDAGKLFSADPKPFIKSPKKRTKFQDCIRRVLDDLIIELNAESSERDEDNRPIDYKRELKSQSAVKELSRSILTQYRKSIARSRVSSFNDEWANE